MEEQDNTELEWRPIKSILGEEEELICGDCAKGPELEVVRGREGLWVVLLLRWSEKGRKIKDCWEGIVCPVSML